MTTYILGIDISTSVIGFAVIDLDFKLITYDKLKFKSNLPLEQRAEYFKNKIIHYDKYYTISDVYIEAPALMFGRGRTTAQTMAKLQRFNGMCSYAVYDSMTIIPELIHANSARKKMNISVPRNVKNKKHYIIDCVKAKYPSFDFSYTRYGNPQPGTDDIADAIVIAHAGVCLKNEGLADGEIEDSK